MKLLFENWRKYLNEVENPAPLNELFGFGGSKGGGREPIPFGEDRKHDKSHEDHLLGWAPLWKWRDDSQIGIAQGSTYAMEYPPRVHDIEDLTRGQILNNHAVAKIIDYVSGGEQPTEAQMLRIYDVFISRQYPDILRWYKGTAFRGMMVTDEWLLEMITRALHEFGQPEDDRGLMNRAWRQ